MERRKFLAGAGVGAAAAAATLPKPALAQQRIDWRMVMPWPRNAPGVGVNAQRFADRVTAMSGGRLTVKLFAGGELVPPFEALDAVQQGVADALHGTSYYWAGKASALHFFTTVPFGLTASELAGWLYYGGGQALWEEVYAPMGIQPFYAGSSGLQAGGWFRKEINRIEDLKGLKIRIAGMGGEAMRRLGANVTLIPPGEIFPAMQSGAIDAAEWVGPWNDLAFGLFKVAKYYYLPAFHEPGPALEVAVNADRYQALPDDLKAVVRYAAQSVADETLAEFTYNNIQSLGPIVDQYGAEIRTFSDEIVDALGDASLAAIKDLGAESPLNDRVYRSYMDYARKAARYSTGMEGPMLAQRARVLGV